MAMLMAMSNYQRVCVLCSVFFSSLGSNAYIHQIFHLCVASSITRNWTETGADFEDIHLSKNLHVLCDVFFGLYVLYVYAYIYTHIIEYIQYIHTPNICIHITYSKLEEQRIWTLKHFRRSMQKREWIQRTYVRRVSEHGV